MDPELAEVIRHARKDRLLAGREPRPAAQRFLVLSGQRLAAALLAQGAAGAQAEVQIVEDFG